MQPVSGTTSDYTSNITERRRYRIEGCSRAERVEAMSQVRERIEEQPLSQAGRHLHAEEDL